MQGSMRMMSLQNTCHGSHDQTRALGVGRLLHPCGLGSLRASREIHQMSSSGWGERVKEAGIWSEQWVKMRWVRVTSDG